MSLKTDLTGRRFGMLTAIESTDERQNGNLVWKCKCDCGNIIEVPSDKLRHRQVKDCGCQKDREVKPGDKFGLLTTVEVVSGSSRSSRIWKCECSCGTKDVLVSERNLINAIKKSCGCLQAKRKTDFDENKDYTGKRVGLLTAVEPTTSKLYGHILWRCKCDCGNDNVLLSTYELERGVRKSCGCVRGKNSSRHKYYKDITNQKFGKLKAIEPTDQRKNFCVVWKCECDCGKYTYASSSELSGLKKTSCGCDKK